MSRCFPYPPPGYALSRASKDALIESIKLQNKEVKSKEQRKEERKKEKKEKRKEKKEKDKHKLDLLSKGCKAESGQQLEGSSVTEEYGKPMCLPAPSTSSDSTEHSNKRKRRHPSPAGSTHGHGKVIRMRLPLKKLSQTCGAANGQNEQPCSTSGRISVTKNESDRVCSASQPIEIPFTRKTPNYPSMTSAVVTTPMQKLELQYINLMDSLVPPLQQDSCFDEAEDLDWLLTSRNRELCKEKKSFFGNEVISSCGKLWPFTQYLKEVDVYALPYTVPY